jgi:bacillithiol biosynthesis cysteine-adding enzyme BshC
MLASATKIENKTVKVNLNKIGVLSRLINDLVNEDNALEPFCSSFGNLNDFEEIIKNKANSYSNRKTLVESLTNQHKGYPDKLPLIKLLGENNTFTVTTGHQLNLLGGAAYTLYKAISTIKLAENLKSQFPENNFIPFFWLASEDHDFEEISSATINNHQIKWQGEYRFETGRINSEALRSVHPEFLKAFSETEKKSDVFADIEEIWFNPKPNETLSDTMRRFIYYCFSDYPLLVIDGNCKHLKSLVKPYFAKEITEQTGFENISETNINLKKLGYHNQVTPRDINLFYLSEKERVRITKSGKNQFKFVGSNKIFSENEILELLEKEPEKFSPNAVLRPLYQEVILPNLAYIGGGGEIAYWLQLKTCFDAFNVPFPAALLRNSVLTTETKIERKMKKLSIDFESIFLDIDALKNKVAEKQSTFIPDFESIKNQIGLLYSNLEKDLISVEPTLAAPNASALKRSEKQLDNLKKKFIKAEKNKQSDNMRLIEEIKTYFFPLGTFQERKVTCTELLVKNGKEFIDLVYKNIDFPSKDICFVKVK